MVVHQGQFARAVDAADANYRAEVKLLEARFNQLPDPQLQAKATPWEALSFGSKAAAVLRSVVDRTFEPSLHAKVAARVLAARPQKDAAQTDNK